MEALKGADACVIVTEWPEFIGPRLAAMSMRPNEWDTWWSMDATVWTPLR